MLKLADVYMRHLARRKACLIFISLRFYKNKNGSWPARLDKIKNFTAAENFIDPFNGGPFVYKLTEENFMLYSKGKNNIDEGGKYLNDANDWPIWPPRGSIDKKADANDRQD